MKDLFDNLTKVLTQVERALMHSVNTAQHKKLLNVANKICDVILDLEDMTLKGQIINESSSNEKVS